MYSDTYGTVFDVSYTGYIISKQQKIHRLRLFSPSYQSITLLLDSFMSAIESLNLTVKSRLILFELPKLAEGGVCPESMVPTTKTCLCPALPECKVNFLLLKPLPPHPNSCPKKINFTLPRFCSTCVTLIVFFFKQN